MSLKINYVNKKNSLVKSNTILFVNEKFDVETLKKIIPVNELSYIRDLLKNKKLKKKFYFFILNKKKK